MVIFLIHWRILPEQIDAFLEKWKSGLTVKNRDGLIGEFLSEVKDPSFFENITWELDEISDSDRSQLRSEQFKSFVNVGLWRSKEDFLENIGGYFPKTPRAMESFEAAPRRRAVVDPVAWRIGAALLPSATSSDVVF